MCLFFTHFTLESMEPLLQVKTTPQLATSLSLLCKTAPALAHTARRKTTEYIFENLNVQPMSYLLPRILLSNCVYHLHREECQRVYTQQYDLKYFSTIKY